MGEKRFLYFALGLLAVVSLGAVTNQFAPLAPTSGLAFSDTAITFPDGTMQLTAAGKPAPPCFNATERFVDCGNGTVTDTSTGLIYLLNANCFGLQTWTEANQSAAALADGQCGLSDGSRAGDWRLQTSEEWDGILDSSGPCIATPPGLVGNASPSVGCYNANAWASGVVGEGGFYWSSTTTANTTTAGSAVLPAGQVFPVAKTTANYVWPVRGGQ
jgi:hypothetical protein